MYYYEVLASTPRYHGKQTLTYQSLEKLQRGTIVEISIRSTPALAVIVQSAPQPQFATKALTANLELPPLPISALELITWLTQYYPSSIGAITQLFVPSSLLKKQFGASLSAPSPIKKFDLPSLTTEQASMLQSIDASGTYVLHGETGTGKTRVYIELTRRALSQNRSAIVLTPEISLTPQLATDFQAVFSGRVVVMHSKLSDRERMAIWLTALQSTKPLVIIGPRSALFVPVAKLGLIIVDEAHDSAYKQGQSPYYNTLHVAGKLAALHKATFILGSATPSVTDYYIAEQKHIPILRMQQAARKSDFGPSTIQVVDLKDRSQFSRQHFLSDQLLRAVEAALGRGEQSLLFLNRRGTARIVLCQKCGWQAQCPRCGLPLTYHGDDHSMRCHTCGYHQATVTVCPLCGNADVVFKGIGTKMIADAVTRYFPRARLQRFDTDNLKGERFEQHYETVKAGSVDILVGTQTLAKGLDLPRLAVVGVICADSSLYLPDYTSGERTFQLLSQVMGRVGRGHRHGQIIVQTYTPDNPVIQAALNKDWTAFYAQELRERQTFMFPPFCYLLKLSCRRASSSAAQRAATALVTDLEAQNFKIQVVGPSPAFHEKLGKTYQWQVVVKAKIRQELLKVIDRLPTNWTYDIDPIDLL